MKRLFRLIIVLLSILTAPMAWAQSSACTAIWGVIDDDGAGGGNTHTLRYFNTATNRWVNLNPTVTLSGQANANASDPTTGIIYYVNRQTNPDTLIAFNLNTGVQTTIGTLPNLPGGNSNTLGATINSAGDLILMASDGGIYFSRIAGPLPTTNIGAVPLTYGWTLVSGATSALGNSGDIYYNNAGNAFLVSNTATPSVWPINFGSPTFGQITGASVTMSISGVVPWGIAVSPIDNTVYLGANHAGTTATYRLNPTTGALTALDPSVYIPSDMGNCIAAPGAPTVTKSFSPTYVSGTSGTSTLSIRINNPNTVPIWLTSEFRDSLPAGMVVGTTPSLNGGACAASATVTNVISAPASSTSVTFASGGRIPAGGCTISFTVSATVSLNAYTNTIAAGSLTTTAGSNPAAATAAFKVGTDFSVVKSQANVVGGPYTTATTSVGAGLTMQYVLTIVNSAVGGTGSVTFTDTLPTLITPVLTITAAQTGGGSCATVSSVVTGRTQIRGTVTNAPPGATCTVTVTARGSSTIAVPTSTQNTVTLLPTASTGDASSANNGSTVTTTINPIANLRITKTNNVTSVNAGQTFSYTITVANYGPANAAGSTFLDPAISGLNCTTATFISTPAGSVSTSPSPLTMNAIRTTGVQLTPSFPANSSATFRLTCGVSATGQP